MSRRYLTTELNNKNETNYHCDETRVTTFLHKLSQYGMADLHRAWPAWHGKNPQTAVTQWT